MSTTSRALAALIALAAPLAALAEPAALPDLTAEVKRVEALPPERHLTELAAHLRAVLARADGVPAIKADGRQMRVQVAEPGPGGAHYYEYEYFTKDRTVRIKALDKEKTGVAKVWWPAGAAPILDFLCEVRDGAVVCKIAPTPDPKQALEVSVKLPKK